MPSLAAFGLAGTGASTEVKIDTAEEQNIRVRLGDPLSLPSQVTVFNNDGSSSKAEVTWQNTADDGTSVEALSAKGPAEYKVYGSVKGMEGVSVLAKIAVVEPNYLDNASFEDKDLSMWKWEDLTGKMKELNIEENKNNAKTGSKSLHFWSDSEIYFTVEQTVTGLKSGTYKLSVVLHGGDAGTKDDQESFIFAKTSGNNYSESCYVDGWRNFKTPVIKGIKVGADGKAVVGATIKCNAGSWGNLDDFVLTPQE